MNNRRHGRVNTRGVASHLRGQGKFTPGMSVENLSMGGAFVRSSDPLALNAAVVIDLVRPGADDAIRLSGRVVSVVTQEESAKQRRLPGMGIQFDPMQAETAEKLRALLLSIAPTRETLASDSKRPWTSLPPGEPPPPRAVSVPPIAPQAASAPATPAPPPAAAAPFDSSAAPPVESGKLMVQVRGLLSELGDRELKIKDLERENEQLRAEIRNLRARLRSAGDAR